MTNVLLLYDVFIPSVRLCGYEQLKYLKKSGLVNFTSSNVKSVTKNDLFKSDVVIFIRSSTYLEEQLAKKLKKARKYLVYVLDDDLLDVFSESNTAKYFNSPTTKRRIRKIMGYCDAFVSPSDRLIKKYGGTFIKTVRIDEPCWLTENYKKTNEKIIIGFAGSIDRATDVDLVLSETIKIIMDKYGDRVVIEFMGAKPKIVEEMKLAYYPYEDSYEKYKKVLSDLQWDIGLAPLPDTSFHKSKYYNKYIEYGSNKIIGVYSNIEPYSHVIKSQFNGLLCDNNTQDWVDKISLLIEDNTMFDYILNNVTEDISKNYNIKSITDNLIEQLAELTEYKAADKIRIFLSWVKIKSQFMRVYEYIKRSSIREVIDKVNYLFLRRKKDEK